MAYHYYMVRRTELEDIDQFLERQCFNLNPDQWVLIYKDRMLGNIDADDGGIPLTVDDLDELDRYMTEQEQAWKDQHNEQVFAQALTGKHTMTGAKAAPLVWGQQSWSQWH